VGKSAADLAGEGRAVWGALLVLGNGFILTALLWGAALVAIIERRLRVAGAVLAMAAVATLFGLIHSPLSDGAVFWPWAVASGTPHTVAAAYGIAAGLLLLLGRGEG
jgi:AGZA family xanthine/uracil permease-like MFS transporter